MPDKREPLKDGITRITSERSGKVNYEARWTWEDQNGRRRYGRERFESLKLAKQHRARMITEAAAGTYAPRDRTTVTEFTEQWMERRAMDWSTSTTYSRKLKWKSHLKERIGHLRMTAVGRSDCQRVITEMHAEGLAAATIRGTAVIMSAMFNAACDEGLLARNPARRLDLPSLPQGSHETWTRAQVKEFLRFTERRPLHALYYVLATTGMRIGEALALQWSAVDLERGRVTVEATLRANERGVSVASPGTKTGRARTLGLTPGCVVALRANLATQDTFRTTSATWVDQGFVFANRFGRNYSQRVVNRLLQEDMEASGITPQLTAHGFRHTIATLMMEEGVQSRAIQDQLGHTSIVTTLNMYAHVSDDLRQTVSARLADMFDSDSNTTTTTSIEAANSD